MRISFALFTLAIVVLVSSAPRATVIDFEDLTPTDPNGFPSDSCGTVENGYHGFDWSGASSGGPVQGKPGWASLEGYLSVPGTGTAYAYGRGLSMSARGGEFDLTGVDVGSYFHAGQEVTLAGWSSGALKYRAVMTLGPTFEMIHLAPGYRDIDRFALWAGSRGALSVPFDAPHVLCVDNIAIEDASPAPVPEPSTLLILGSGILGFTRIFRKLAFPKGAGSMQC
jgi:hypothetical protein